MKEGWMTKQGALVKNWKKRYFKIIGTEIIYYSDVGKNKKGSLDLAFASDVSIATPQECSHQPALKITIEKPKFRIYYFQTKDTTERDSWIESINEVINQSKSSSDSKSSQSSLISINDFEFIKVLGRGSYGKVQLVKYKKDGKLYALKYMKKKKIIESGQVDQTFAERDILINVHHPFLVSGHFSFQTEDKIFLVLDYVKGGDLKNHLKDLTRISEPEVCFYGAQILLGLGALHSGGYIYRDLKPENILIDEDGYIKITDFGLIKKNITNDPSHSTFCGTPHYLAPEIIRGDKYSSSVDWWSFGIVLYELMTGKTPFYDENTSKMYHKIQHGKVQFPNYFSHDAKDLISRLLDKNADPDNCQARLGSVRDFEEIKEHPFFAQIEWDDLLNKKVEPFWKPNISDDNDTSNFSRVYTSQQAGISPQDVPIDTASNTQFSGFSIAEPIE